MFLIKDDAYRYRVSFSAHRIRQPVLQLLRPLGRGHQLLRVPGGHPRPRGQGPRPPGGGLHLLHPLCHKPHLPHHLSLHLLLVQVHVCSCPLSSVGYVQYRSSPNPWHMIAAPWAAPAWLSTSTWWWASSCFTWASSSTWSPTSPSETASTTARLWEAAVTSESVL